MQRRKSLNFCCARRQRQASAAAAKAACRSCWHFADSCIGKPLPPEHYIGRFANRDAADFDADFFFAHMLLFISAFVPTPALHNARFQLAQHGFDIVPMRAYTLYRLASNHLYAFSLVQHSLIATIAHLFCHAYYMPQPAIFRSLRARRYRHACHMYSLPSFLPLPLSLLHDKTCRWRFDHCRCATEEHTPDEYRHAAMPRRITPAFTRGNTTPV